MHKLKFVLIAFLLCLTALAQTAPQQQPQPTPPQGGAQVEQQQQKSQQGEQPKVSPATPPSDRKMSQAEADELFRSVDELTDFASKVTGLPKKHSVKRELSSRDEVEHYIEQKMKEDKDAKRLERAELVLKRYGLLPREFELRTFMVKMLKEQVAGFYDTKRRTVYLLDWLDPDAQKPVMAHELTHALQDQSFPLDKFSDSAREKNERDVQGDERVAARQAVVEGQATAVLLDWMLAPYNANITSQPQLVDQMVAAMTAGESTPVLASAPMYLKELLVFPYTYGLNFVRAVLTAKGKEAAFAGLFTNPPQDTREIMVPSAYLAGQHETGLTPPDLEKVLGGNWRKFDIGSIGAFDVTVIAQQFAGPEAAKGLAEHFRSAYYYSATPKHAQPTMDNMAVVTVAQFDSPEAAAKFARTIYLASIKKRYAQARLQPSDNPQVERFSTELGPVVIELRGNTAMISEGFDDAAVAKLAPVVFSAAKAE